MHRFDCHFFTLMTFNSCEFPCFYVVDPDFTSLIWSFIVLHTFEKKMLVIISLNIFLYFPSPFSEVRVTCMLDCLHRSIGNGYFTLCLLLFVIS